MRYLADLRARSAPEILDATFGLYRKQFVVFVLIAAAFTIPTATVVALVPDVLALFVNALGNVLLPIAEGAVVLCVIAELSGRAPGVGEVFRQMRGKMSRVVGVALGCGILILLGTILLLVPGVIAFIWTTVAVPVCVIEGGGFDSAFKRSRALARGHAWHVLGTMLLTWVLLAALSVAGMFATGLVAQLFGAGARASNLLFSGVEAVLFPVLGIVATLLYLDLRVRSEGADIEAMAAGLPPVSEAGAELPPPRFGTPA